MNICPEFIKPIFDISGDWGSKLEDLYQIFRNDFIIKKCKLENKMIVFNKNKNIDNKEDGFWHLITRDDIKYGRLPDFRRAERLHWISPIIENIESIEIKAFDYLEGSGKIRKYLWLYDYDFVVILEPCRNKKCFFLVTAFFIDKYNKPKFKKNLIKELNKVAITV